MTESRSGAFRWQSFFQRAREALFLLSRQRRILFVNQAWEELTGVAAGEARGLACTRRAPLEEGPVSALARALAPPREVLEGKPGRARCLVSGTGAGRRWWDVHFFPLHDEKGVLCILGKVAPVSADEAAQTGALAEALVALRDQVAQRHGMDGLASDLPALGRVAEQARLASATDSAVLIVGEPGTGKQWLARAIHYQGRRRGQAFAALECAALPEAALAAALFGAGGLTQRPGLGTLCLKEPSRLPRDLQAKLLEILRLRREEPSRTAARVIAGCSIEPGEEIRSGRLLEELYCELSTLVIALPPLRQRQADLSWLAEQFLERLNAGAARRVSGITTGAWEVVRAYGWPGNLREFYSVLAGARARAKSDRIDVADLPAYLRLATSLERTPAVQPPRALPLDQLLEEAERRLIKLALRLAQGNKSRAADLLAVWRPRLHRRMEALGINDSEAESGAQPAKDQEDEPEILPPE